MDRQFYLDLLDEIADGVYFVSPDRRITYWNHGAERITGYSADEVIGHSCSEGILRHVNEAGSQLCLHGCPLAAVMRDGRKRQADVFLHHKDGHRVPVAVRGNAIHGDNDEIAGSVEVFTVRITSPFALAPDETSRDGMDPVTHLPPRAFGDKELVRRLRDAHTDGTGLGLLFADLDHFKAINDTYGHRVGDAVLRMAAQSLANALGRDDIPIRWGGEEFVVILPDADEHRVLRTAERVRMLVENSWLTSRDEQVRATVSIGATVARPDDSVESLVDRADQHMYVSKSAGRNRVTSDSGGHEPAAELPLLGVGIPWDEATADSPMIARSR